VTIVTINPTAAPIDIAATTLQLIIGRPVN
jgi:hypothetical protein